MKNVHFSTTKSVDEKILDKLQGQMVQLTIEAKVTKKLAENAFRMASASNVSVSILSKGMGARPKFLSKEQLLGETAAKKKLEDLFGNDEAEFLKPLLSDDEIEIIDQARKQYEKAKAKGEVI